MSHRVIGNVFVFSTALAWAASILAPAAFGGVVETVSDAGMTFNYRCEFCTGTNDIVGPHFGLSTWSTGSWSLGDSLGPGDVGRNGSASAGLSLSANGNQGAVGADAAARIADGFGIAWSGYWFDFRLDPDPPVTYMWLDYSLGGVGGLPGTHNGVDGFLRLTIPFVSDTYLVNQDWTSAFSTSGSLHGIVPYDSRSVYHVVSIEFQVGASSGDYHQTSAAGSFSLALSGQPFNSDPFAATPEPATMLMLAGGLLSIRLLARRKAI